MINFYNVKLKKTIVHSVGNKSMDEGITFSENIFSEKDNEELTRVLINYFLSSFKNSIFYTFNHPSDLELNDVYNVIKNIFDSPNRIGKASKDLAKILYNCSDHPKIKSGEFYVAYFSDCLKDDEVTDAIGIFKSENKQTFLQIQHANADCSIDYFTGISTQKLDKGAIILNSNRSNGFIVNIIDNLNSNEAQYWKNDFLKLTPFEDNYHTTKSFLSVTKEFITQLPEEYEISKADQVDLLNKSINYFKKNENFNKKNFEKDVFQDKDLISSFHKFDKTFRDENALKSSDNFDISSEAVKKQAKDFKSVLKLDKNFHVYIHGDKNLIEKGIEKDGRKFYKIYFNEEA